MHNLAKDSMKKFRDKWWDGGSVLEIGGGSGSVKELFNGSYTTLDIAGWADIIVANPYSWIEIPNSTYDYVISTSCLEHVEYPWCTMQECYRVLRPGGITCHIMPSAGVEHKYPLDCYRYFTDGGRALLKWAGFKELEVYINNNPTCIDDGGNQFKDIVIIGQKC